jgi:hypothetical protein
MRAVPLLILLQACAAAPPASDPIPAEVVSDEYDFLRVLFPDVAPPRVVNVLETLADPRAVEGWTDRELRLRDGRRLPLPELAKAPSHIVAAATAHGVELHESGIMGLLRIWHEGDNDPVGSHWARVNLGELLRYVTHVSAESARDFRPRFGWNSHAFHLFRRWQISRLPWHRERRPQFILRSDVEALVVFTDGSFRHLRFAADQPGAVSGRFPGDFLNLFFALVYGIKEEGKFCTEIRIPVRLEGYEAEFALAALRREFSYFDR